MLRCVAYLYHLRFLCRLRHSFSAITHTYLRYRTIKGIMTILYLQVGTGR